MCEYVNVWMECECGNIWMCEWDDQNRVFLIEASDRYQMLLTKSKKIVSSSVYHIFEYKNTIYCNLLNCQFST